ncbi:sensor histidine kinase [Peredibacter sp. HCB2-198]|uniref:sensor histidine kinase n=1 Tax=Peredibacter sp. HCB2-198 TaxID=3383025 RepID=UPI0038B498E7
MNILIFLIGTTVIGFAIALAAIIIIRRRQEFERKNLELTIEKLSGAPLNRKLNSAELYQELAYQVGIKEELTRELQNSNSHLEEEREMNEILIKTVSHDLANPLTVINAYIDMINSGRIPEEDRKMIWDRIKMNTKSALDMIARIRDAIVTRNQASIVAINDVSIDRSLKRLITQFESRLEEKNIKVKYENGAPLDTLVAAEENTLTEHVFANVLSNSLKFSHEGSEIIIKVFDIGPTIRVEFQDFGVGIDHERLEKRLLHTTEGTRGELGSGFGVMVMGYFLRKFGASYLIQSDGPGTGTTIIINLRRAHGAKA